MDGFHIHINSKIPQMGSCRNYWIHLTCVILIIKRYEYEIRKNFNHFIVDAGVFRQC